MAKARKPVNVFLDTEVFDRSQYNFASRDFQRLTSLVKDGYVRLFLTAVTEQEIISHLESNASEAYRVVEGFRKKVKDLSPSSASAVSGLNEDTIRSEFISTFKKFCKPLKTTVVPVASVPLDEVLDAYFSKKAPFRDGKKKCEFPDAFAAAALEIWCREKKETMVVVSGDDDWRSRCVDSKELEHKPELVEMFALFPDARLSERIVAALRSEPDKVVDAVREGFPSMGFMLLDADGDIEDIEVDDVELKKFFVVEAKDGHAVVDIDCVVSFTGDVTYEDPDSGMFDYETHSKLFMDTVRGRVDSKATIRIEVLLDFAQDDAQLDLDNVRASVPTDETVDVDLDDVTAD